LTSKEIIKKVKNKKLAEDEYAIVYGGPIIKTFEGQISLEDL
jgi:hypothetical protein